MSATRRGRGYWTLHTSNIYLRRIITFALFWKVIGFLLHKAFERAIRLIEYARYRKASRLVLCVVSSYSFHQLWFSCELSTIASDNSSTKPSLTSVLQAYKTDQVSFELIIFIAGCMDSEDVDVGEKSWRNVTCETYQREKAFVSGIRAYLVSRTLGQRWREGAREKRARSLVQS